MLPVRLLSVFVYRLAFRTQVSVVVACLPMTYEDSGWRV